MFGQVNECIGGSEKLSRMASASQVRMVPPVSPAQEMLSTSERKDCQSGSSSSLPSASRLLSLSPVDDTPQGSQRELIKQKSDYVSSA